LTYYYLNFNLIKLLIMTAGWKG